MILQVLHCPHCQGTDIVRHGQTRQGKQRYRCREQRCKPRHDLRSTSASLSRLAKPGPPYALTCPPERPLSLDQKRPRVLRTSVVRHSWLGRLASGLPSRYNSSPHFTNALDDGLSLTAGEALSRARYGLGCPVRSRLRDGMARAPAGRLP